ncbi:glycine betaine/L-proline transport ATP binding subunit [Pseudomonas fluorescens]|uniref:Glycine betaine/L-proline transport ATP binding subunit n=1 Tax=Pseudomonas fluorescens TaxID=294 RepID=A0A0N8NWK0_PSEFL|nr:glycine betaine/L-proline transport ATP binding subunit [Pseudomonas fluorescens]
MIPPVAIRYGKGLMGGALAADAPLLQINHPDTLLAHPVDEFVSNFVGQDSTLRLLLVKAEDAADNAPSVSPQTSVAEALELIDAERVFLGEVTQESIAAYLSSGRSRGMKTSIVSPAEPVAS